MFAKRKGTRIENELANMLWAKGFAVVRGPSSGAGVRKRYQPDIVAIKNGIVYVIEVKSRKNDIVYIDAGQIFGIQEFAKRSKGIPLVAVKSHGKFKFYTIDMLAMAGNSYKVQGDGYDISFIVSNSSSISSESSNSPGHLVSQS